MKKKVSFYHPRILSSERESTLVWPDEGDEIYCNGVLCFNVSALLE